MCEGWGGEVEEVGEFGLLSYGGLVCWLVCREEGEGRGRVTRMNIVWLWWSVVMVVVVVVEE